VCQYQGLILNTFSNVSGAMHQQHNWPSRNGANVQLGAASTVYTYQRIINVAKCSVDSFYIRDGQIAFALIFNRISALVLRSRSLLHYTGKLLHLKWMGFPYSCLSCRDARLLQNPTQRRTLFRSGASSRCRGPSGMEKRRVTVLKSALERSCGNGTHTIRTLRPGRSASWLKQLDWRPHKSAIGSRTGGSATVQLRVVIGERMGPVIMQVYAYLRKIMQDFSCIQTHVKQRYDVHVFARPSNF